MEELLKNIVEKTGLPIDQAKIAMTNVLGFIRTKIPQQSWPQFDKAITGMGQQGNLPIINDMSVIAEKTGLQAGQVTSLIETVVTFLKNKLPTELVTQMTGAISKGGVVGAGQKVAGLFGGKS